MVRAVCAILDAFHFPLQPTSGTADKAEAAPGPALPDQATPDTTGALTGLPDQAGAPAGLPEQDALGDEAMDDALVAMDEEGQARSVQVGEDHSKAVQDTLVRVVLPSLRSQLVLPRSFP